MRNARAQAFIKVFFSLGLGLALAFGAAPADADENHEDRLCEYQTIELDPLNGEIRLIPPRNVGPQDCSDTGAAIGELNPAWRRALPPSVRWEQRTDAPAVCLSSTHEMGQRTAHLPGQGCVFLRPRERCSIVTAQAVSHAQLANAVRLCVP